jgi:hypothetical protein
MREESNGDIYISNKPKKDKFEFSGNEVMLYIGGFFVMLVIILFIAIDKLFIGVGIGADTVGKNDLYHNQKQKHTLDSFTQVIKEQNTKIELLKELNKNK